MKKLLLYIIVMLLLFAGCSTEVPVLPEPEAEQPVHTEQVPVKEQPQVDVPEELETPEEPDVPEEPEIPEEPEVPEESEEPEVIETVSYADAVREIAELLGYEEESEDYAAYAEQHGLSMFMYDTGWEDPISYRDASVLLYNAAEHHQEELPMAVVTEESPKIKGIHDGSDRHIMYMYHWGILYGDAPESWFDCIPAEKFDEMLQRARLPEVRMELLPDQLTQLSRKLAKVEHCGCAKTRAWPTAGAAYTMLAEWEGLPRALEYSFWIAEYQDGIHYLNMFTGMEDGTVAFTRCSYDASTKQGEISETITLAQYDLSRPETGILYSVCMTDEQKEMFQNELLDGYLQRFCDEAERYPKGFSPYLNGYLAAYAAPWQEDPGLMLVAMDEYMLHSYIFGGGEYGQMAHSWYHIYSMDISTGLDALRAAADKRKEQQRQKAMEAAFCPCMAREFAEWRVCGDSELVPVVRTAFANYVTAHSVDLAKEYGDLLTDTYWLIDQDWNGRYYLQIIQFKKTSAAQMVMLVYDGSAVTVHEGTKTLTGVVESACIVRCSNETRETMAERLTRAEENLDESERHFFTRLSALENGSCINTDFGPVHVFAFSYEPAGMTGGMEIKDLVKPEKRLDGMTHWMEKIYSVDYSELGFGNDKDLVLDFLTANFTVENGLDYWNLPVLISEHRENAYLAKNTLESLLEELEKDPAMKELFMQMEQWKIHPLSWGCSSISGADSNGREWEAVVYPGVGVDMEGWVTPTRKAARELSDSGENSELVPEAVREEFVTFALQLYWDGCKLAGTSGTAQWLWSVADEDVVRLEVRHYSGGVQASEEKRPYEIFVLEKKNGTVSVVDHINQWEELPDV